MIGIREGDEALIEGEGNVRQVPATEDHFKVLAPCESTLTLCLRQTRPHILGWMYPFALIHVLSWLFQLRSLICAGPVLSAPLAGGLQIFIPFLLAIPLVLFNFHV